MKAIDTARDALRSAVKAGRVPKGLNLEIRQKPAGLEVIVVGAPFPVVPADWLAWVYTSPLDRGPMPSCFTTQAQDVQTAIVETLSAALPGITITCDFTKPKPAEVAVVRL